MNFKQLIIRSLTPLNCLLLFLLAFDERLNVPAWLKVFGRMHPLALHFPIVLAVVFAAAIIFLPPRIRREIWAEKILDSLLIAAALTCSLTALMGFFLYKNGGYDPDAIAPHEWTGALIPFILHAAVVYRKPLLRNLALSRLTGLTIALIIILAGHFGSTLTHGENFLLEPVMAGKTIAHPPIEEAVIYADLVQPVLESKCFSCHNSKKAKGNLVMESRDLLIKGGKNGKLWDTTKADLGLLMHRIQLPVEEKKHMPPAGKPQLTDEETDILYNWIRTGADFEKRVAELEPRDSLFLLAKKRLPSAADQQYDFAAADEKKIRELNNNNRVITQVAIASPALRVSFYNRALFNRESLKQLSPLAGQIVELNLENMPVADIDLASIKHFINLRKLNLNFTDITGKTLRELKALPLLQSLSVIGAPVEYSDARDLATLPKLGEVYLWNTRVTGKDIEELQRLHKKIDFHGGYTGDTVSLKLTPPMLKDEALVVDSFLTVRIKHNIPGTVIRFTLDGQDPDSAGSALFKDSIRLNSNITLKAKAFKPGWLGSDVMKKYFFKRTYLPDTVMLLTKPQDQYRASGGKTLYDGEKSDINFASAKWLGFREQPMQALLVFHQPKLIRNVTLSMLKDLSANIFAPMDVEIWIGNSPDKLALVSRVKPLQPSEMEYRENLGIECDFPPTLAKFIKVVAHPLPKVPDWSQNKGDKTTAFIDEIFVN